MSNRKASIKETGEELSQEDWARFDAAVAKVQAERPKTQPYERDKAAKADGSSTVRSTPTGRETAD